MDQQQRAGLLVGADPELFLKLSGKPVSAHNLIPGTKQEPFDVGKGGAIQVDGNALEFNIAPANRLEDFKHNINYVLQQLRDMVPSEYEFDFSATTEFDEQYMESLPEEAKRLGCDPDFNAYTAQANPSPDPHPTMRAAGGHVHLGWTSGKDPQSIEHFMSCCTIMKQMDYVLGLPSVLLDPDKKRREMYGKAGAFRAKSYGGEYRTLSNFWIKNEELMALVYENAQLGYKMLVDEQRFLPNEFGNAAAECINNGDKAQAAYLCDVIGIRSKV
jgi:hypothetical protein